MKTSSIIALIVGIGLIIGALFWVVSSGSAVDSKPTAENVSVIEGTQVINITAKGGYSPRSSVAAADMASILRVTTNGSFDCSTALRIPSLGYSKNLPLTGTVEIPIPPQKAGTTLRGLCSMGMYSFTVAFR